MFLQEQSSARSRALLCTQTTLSVLLVLFVFSLAIKAIFIFKLTITLYDKHQMYSTLNHQIYPVTVRMKILGKSDSQRKNKHKACRYFVYIQHALLYLLCLPLFPCSKLPDACRENDILIKSSWYPSNVWSSANSDILGNGSWYPQINLMTHRNFWMYPPEVLLIS